VISSQSRVETSRVRAVRQNGPLYNGEMAKLPIVDVVGVGLNATDTLIPLEHFPERGSKIEYSGSTVMPGGQVATTMVACQSWGLRTRYVGKLGDDDAARLHKEAFERAGVEAHLVTVAGGMSPQSLILVDEGGERTVLCRRDERMLLQAAELDRTWIVNARALHVDGFETAAATVAAGWAREAGIPVIADLDEAYAGVQLLLENIDYLIVSRDFPGRLMDEPNLEQALKQMQMRYGCRLTAATLGQDGVLAWDGRQFHHCPAYHGAGCGYDGSGRHLPCGFHLRVAAGMAAERPTRFCLRGGGNELYGQRSSGRHSASGFHRGHEG
jgi:sulfofructose kinase